MSGAEARFVGLHGSRCRRVGGICEAGLWRDPSGYFLLDREQPGLAASLAATLPVAIYFALGLRTVEGWIAGDGGAQGSYADWFGARPQERPALVLFELPGEPSQAGECYVSQLAPSPATSAPYTTVENGGLVPASRVRAIVTATGGDLGTVDARLDPTLPALSPGAMPKPFFRKQRGTPIQPGDEGGSSPYLARHVPALCQALADSLIEPVHRVVER